MSTALLRDQSMRSIIHTQYSHLDLYSVAQDHAPHQCQGFRSLIVTMLIICVKPLVEGSMKHGSTALLTFALLRFVLSPCLGLSSSLPITFDVGGGGRGGGGGEGEDEERGGGLSPPSLVFHLYLPSPFFSPPPPPFAVSSYIYI